MVSLSDGVPTQIKF